MTGADVRVVSCKYLLNKQTLIIGFIILIDPNRVNPTRCIFFRTLLF